MKAVIETLSRWSPADAQDWEPEGYSTIEDIEEASKGPLPDAYVAFLRAMGRGLGQLQVDELEMRAPRIEERYAIGSWTPPAPLVCIGLDQAPLAPRSCYLDRSRPCGSDDCAVVRFRLPESGEDWRNLATLEFVSLREMLAYWGFVSLRVGQLGWQTILAPAATTEAAGVDASLQEILAQWPVRPLPYMNVSQVFDGEGLSVLVDRDAETGRLLAVRVAAGEPQEHTLRVAMLKDAGLDIS